jgi:hypothetical protein
VFRCALAHGVPTVGDDGAANAELALMLVATFTPMATMIAVVANARPRWVSKRCDLGAVDISVLLRMYLLIVVPWNARFNWRSAYC